jgi:hypothetical protein
MSNKEYDPSSTDDHRTSLRRHNHNMSNPLFRGYYNAKKRKFDFASTNKNEKIMSKELYYDHDDDMLLYHSGLPLKDPSSTTANTTQNSSQSDNNNNRSPITTRWSIGKISVLILACLSLTDIIFHMVDAQMESLEAPDYYDALSADVIRPAFRYHHTDHHHHHRKPTMGLGSAAISSVTTALNPILPFTGGIDLRREDYWTNGWFGSVSSVVQQVRDAFASNAAASDMVLETPRGGASIATKTRSNNKDNKKSKKGGSSNSNKVTNRNVVLSSTEPFVPLKDIAELTLKDVAMTFRFAVENTRKDFNSGKFLSSLLPRAKTIVDKMVSATSTCRGRDVVPPLTGEAEPPIPSGDIDALSFCSAMRVFAEWRILRQVPPGYKGYAVGMTLGQKDIVQNIAKIEQAI